MDLNLLNSEHKHFFKSKSNLKYWPNNSGKVIIEEKMEPQLPNLWEIKCEVPNCFPSQPDLVQYEKKVKQFVHKCYL